MFAMTHILTTRIEDGTSFASPANGWRPRRRRMERSKIAVPPNTLAEITIFAGLTPEALEAVHRRCSWRRYEAGEPIVDYLDSSDDVFFVTAGEASVSVFTDDGRALSVRRLRPGELFGEYAANDGEPRSASVEAR